MILKLWLLVYVWKVKACSSRSFQIRVFQHHESMHSTAEFLTPRSVLVKLNWIILPVSNTWLNAALYWLDELSFWTILRKIGYIWDLSLLTDVSRRFLTARWNMRLLYLFFDRFKVESKHFILSSKKFYDLIINHGWKSAKIILFICMSLITKLYLN